jgi:hypothetical protein
VDLCIEQARQDAIDCTLAAIPFTGGWRGVESSLEYLDCLERLRHRLLDCDRRAKQDTHCEDQPGVEERIASAAGLPPSRHA